MTKDETLGISNIHKYSHKLFAAFKIRVQNYIQQSNTGFLS